MGGIAADRRNIDHAVSELNEGTSLDWDIQVGNVVKDEAGELLVLLLSNPFDERETVELSSLTVGGKTVLSEGIVEKIDH